MGAFSSSSSCAALSIGSKVGACGTSMVRRYANEAFLVRDDFIIEEARIKVYLNGELLLETSCSPWNIEELVVGNLFLSGKISHRSQIDDIQVELSDGSICASVRAHSFDRRFVVVRALPKKPSFEVTARQVNEGISRLESLSGLFRQTGGVHSAVLTDGCEILAWFEDIGRHSAFDKLIGWSVLNEIETGRTMVLFSGRVPYEIISRVIKLGSPIIVSPGAPTDLSIDTARKNGTTLIGFAKNGAFNVYTHAERVTIS